MASSESYSDFERRYDAHLSKVRSFLARPNNRDSPDHAANVSSCEQDLRSAERCIHAMRGLAEIEGDPFKAEEAKRRLERDIGPLEEELGGRRAAGGGGGGGGFSSAFLGSNGAGGRGVPARRTTTTTTNGDQRRLFGDRTTASYAYAPPSMGGEDDPELGASSLTAPLTETERRTMESEHLLRETQALCAASEQTGAATLETMGWQREQMERSSGLLHQSMENTQQARQIMKEMARRALKNKRILYCIIALLALANGAVILHLWRRKKQQ